MDTLTLALAAGLSWSSGIRLYATVFFLGLLQFSGPHYGDHSALPPSLAVLAHPWVIGISGLLFITEFLADKVPGFDSLWDALHTFIRIPGGALMAAAAVIDADPGLALAAGLLGGTLAASAHLTKAGSRALINLSPEPVSNWLASLSEDVLTLGVLCHAQIPVTAADTGRDSGAGLRAAAAEAVARHPPRPRLAPCLNGTAGSLCSNALLTSFSSGR